MLPLVLPDYYRYSSLHYILFVQQNPAKQGSGSSGNGGSGEKAERNKKRVRQPGSTADRQRAKAVGQVSKRYVYYRSF